MFKIVRIFCGVLLCFCLPSAAAGSFQIGVEVGKAYPADSDFHNAEAMRLLVGYSFTDTIFVEAGAFDFLDDLDAKSRDAAIDIEGYNFQINKIFEFGRVNAEVGAGVFYWDAEAFFDGRRVGEESGSSGLLNMRISFKLGSRFRLYADGKRLRDVSGSDIDLLMFGSRFSF